WETDGNRWRLSEMVMDHASPDTEILESCVANDNAAGAIIEADETPDIPIGTWQVTSLPDVTPIAEHEPIVTINADGSINGNTGCNTFGSNAVLTGTGISISNNFMTRMACEDARHVV